MRGNLTRVRGNLTRVRGNLTRVRGNLTRVRGNLILLVMRSNSAVGRASYARFCPTAAIPAC